MPTPVNPWTAKPFAEPLSCRPRGVAVSLTEIDELCLAEAARAGLTAPATILPEMSLEAVGTELAVLEGRIALLEQRVHWVMTRNGYPFA